MYKAAVMGDRDSIYGFAALGLSIFPVTDTKEAADLLHELAGQEYAVIYMTEALTGALASEIAKYDRAMTPAVIPLPGAFGNTGCGIDRVRHFVEQAVGSDIIFGDAK